MISASPLIIGVLLIIARLRRSDSRDSSGRERETPDAEHLPSSITWYRESGRPGARRYRTYQLCDDEITKETARVRTHAHAHTSVTLMHDRVTTAPFALPTLTEKAVANARRSECSRMH